MQRALKASALDLRQLNPGSTALLNAEVVIVEVECNTVPVKSLRCVCCKKETPGRQWYGAGPGWGSCHACIPSAQRALSSADLQASFGVRGFHYDVEAA